MSDRAPACPECGSRKIWKDGLRKLADGSRIQRYLCRECGFRFSLDDKSKIRRREYYSVDAHQEALFLVEEAEALGRRDAGATAKPKELLFNFAWWMKKQGYAESTIELRTDILRFMLKNGVNLYDPEQVKEFIAKRESWGEGRKNIAVVAYNSFARFAGLSWEPPRYKRTRKIPFIPLEREIDQLIAGCGKVVAAFLQGLKETGADPSELLKVEWSDVDFEKKIVRINHPVKGHDSRVLPITEKWIRMLKRLPKRGDRIFQASFRSLSLNFRRQRNKLAAKLNNPRLKKISFTTIRHWKGTVEYHKTKDILHVKKILGHKSIESTMIYINIEQALYQNTDDEFHVKAAHTDKEAMELLEAGFEYVCTTPNGAMLFRKRK